jgi:hypothetical protein
LTALDKEYWAALCSLALEATNVSAQRASAKKQPTAKPLLGGDFLGQLSASGRITVHGVFDLRIVPSFTWHAARVTDIRVTALDTEPRLAPGDYLDVLIEHSGRQLILEQEEIPAGGGSDEKPASHYYFFQSGTDVARQWSARAQFKDGLTANDVTRPVTDVDPNAKNLIQLMLASNAAPAANVMFTPYNPGIYSLFTIGVSRPPAADGSPVPLPKITKLALEIDYTASFDDSISRNREVTR